MEKEIATHSSVLAWRIPGMAEPGGLPSMGSHRVGHDWRDLAAAAAGNWFLSLIFLLFPIVFGFLFFCFSFLLGYSWLTVLCYVLGFLITLNYCQPNRRFSILPPSHSLGDSSPVHTPWKVSVLSLDQRSGMEELAGRLKKEGDMYTYSYSLHCTAEINTIL